MAETDELLLLPAEEAARRIALGWLDDARAACARLADPEDAEALHDFRVAIRRLRSTLRAWRPELGVRRRRRKALRALQRATGGGRDAEVALAWLEGRREALAPEQVPGLDHLEARLAGRLEAAMDHARDEVRQGFAVLDAALAPELARLRVDLRDDPSETPRCGAVLAERAREDVVDLKRRLDAVASLADRDACHTARIAGKRLRYLVEPLRKEEEAGRIVAGCKRLQDVLGDLNDAHVLGEEIARTLRQAPPEARPGLEALAAANRARGEELFARLRADWLGAGAVAFAERVDAFATRLEAAAAPALEIERKYLLDRLPDLDALRERGLEVRSLEIDQGWLPGERLRERIRRTLPSEGGAPRYVRTVKLGAGVQRIEIEEEASTGVFEALWPLTDGCRIRKRRHCVRDGGRLWELDEFLDRDLALAEVELPHAALEPELPDWLAPRVTREVTEDRRYTNLALAR